MADLGSIGTKSRLGSPSWTSAGAYGTSKIQAVNKGTKSVLGSQFTAANQSHRNSVSTVSGGGVTVF